MKHLYLFLAIFFAGVISVHAQCPTCVPDLTCTNTTGTPQICPAIPPNATTGVYYEQVMTFFIPTDVVDPGSGVNATLLQLTITDVSGIPFGLEFTLNDADGIFYPPQGENYGCATICGTPVLPGTYDIVISITALAEAFGFQVTQNDSFIITLIVEQGPGGTSTFAFDQSAGCGTIDVDYVATIGGDAGQLTTYNWDFGYGHTGNVADPAPVNYPTPGTYTASLQTVISNYVITSVNLAGVNGNWSGDADDLFSTADPYFTINNGAGSAVYTSGTVNNQTSASYANVNFTLSNPPYTITFWDSDDITQDDNLGTSSFNIAVGSQSFNSGNGTSGTINIALSEVTNISASTSISVFPQPDALVSVAGNVISCPNDTMPTYFWYYDGVLISGESGPSLTMTESGYYSVYVQNEFGCSSTSEPYLYCAPIEAFWNAAADQLSVADTYDTYQWFYNGMLLQGAITYYLISPPNGVYAVQVTNSYGCVITSEMITVNVGVEEIALDDQLNIYPNPVTDVLNVQWNNTTESANLSIRDLSGRLVLSERVANGNAVLDLSNLSSGNYILELQMEDRTLRKQVIKQ
ncbi:MAG: T9SS type A sorting domain-containing protein [Sediminibacterium sp.]